MFVKASCQISENIDQITTPLSAHFLVCGQHALLVDGTPLAVYQDLKNELLKFLENLELLKFVALTNFRACHLGSIPLIKQAAPWVKVIGPAKYCHLLEDKRFLESAFEQNLAIAKALQREVPISFDEWSESLRIDIPVEEGSKIDLGLEVELKVLGIPSYRPEALGYYVKPDAGLAAGESLGSYNGRSKSTPCFQQGLEQYLDFLGSLSDLELRSVSLPFSGCLTGELIGRFLPELRQEAQGFRDGVLERLAQGELAEEIFKTIYVEWLTDGLCPEGPYSHEQETCLKSMIDSVLERK